MNYLWSFGVVCFLLLIATIRIDCMCGFRQSAENEAVRILNDELHSLFSEPNRWGYVFSDYPRMCQNGLTYWVECWIDMKEVKCSTIEEAEKVYVDIYADLYKKISLVRAIRPFLAAFPFTPFTLCLNVRFRDSDGAFLSFPNISSLTLWREDLSYNQYSSTPNKPASFEVICKKKAKDVIGLRDFYVKGVPRGPVVIKKEIPIIEKLCLRDDSPLGRAKFEFAKKFCVESNLKIVMLGTVGESYHDSRHFEFSLRGTQRFQLDEARELAARCSRELFGFVQNDQRCLEYAQERSSWRSEKHTSATPTPEMLAFRISFWDENVDRQPSPYISEIRLLDGRFSYFTSDDLQRLVLVREESFDDAQAFLKAVDLQSKNNQ